MQRFHRGSLNRRPIKYLLLSIVSLCGLIYLILAYSPQDAIMLLFLFYLLLFLLFFSIITYFLKSHLHGILTGIVIVVYLLFRQVNLTHPFFLIMLLALFLTVELLIVNKK